jgi:hypothetical protein
MVHTSHNSFRIVRSIVQRLVEEKEDKDLRYALCDRRCASGQSAPLSVAPSTLPYAASISSNEHVQSVRTTIGSS